MQPTLFETSVGSLRKSIAASGRGLSCESRVERPVRSVPSALPLAHVRGSPHLLVVALESKRVKFVPPMYRPSES